MHIVKTASNNERRQTMSLIESIHNIIQRAASRQSTSGEKDDVPGTQSAPALQSHEGPARLQQLLNGLGTGTARLVID
jgi:hypothetical protein